MRLLFLLSIFLLSVQNIYSQSTKEAVHIDSILTKEGRKLNLLYKDITDSSMLFVFTIKGKDDIFRITAYRNKRDTIFNYLYLGTFLRCDLKIRRKYAIYYFENNKLVGAKEANLSMPDPFSLMKKGNDLRKASENKKIMQQ